MTGKSYTCHNCPRGRGPHCVRCSRVDFDDIRIQHQPHNRAELQAAQTKPPSTPVTSLPPAVENRLREFIFDLFDLDPLQLHLLSHVRNGGTPNTFGRTFAAFLKSSIMYGQRKYRARWNRTVDEIGANITRATAWAIWDAMVKKSPLLAIFQTWAQGHGGRKAKPKARRARRYVQTVMPFFDEGQPC